MAPSVSGNGEIGSMDKNLLRWPAEWEEQRAVWFSWPHRFDTFAGRLDLIEKKFAEIIRTITPFQAVSINAPANLHARIRQHFCSEPATQSNIELHDHPTDDVWCRDHGSTFVKDLSHKTHSIDWKG